MGDDVRISREADGKHLEIKSSDGTWWKIAVDDDGNISTIEL